MLCPPKIAATLLRILETGLLRARAAAWAGDAERSAREIDHLHNLPALIAEYSPELLKYYWEVERSGFVEFGARAGATTTGFEPLWQQLQVQMQGMLATVRAQ